jgi:hypothetical protein
LKGRSSTVLPEATGAAAKTKVLPKKQRRCAKNEGAAQETTALRKKRRCCPRNNGCPKSRGRSSTMLQENAIRFRMALTSQQYRL